MPRVDRCACSVVQPAYGLLGWALLAWPLATGLGLALISAALGGSDLVQGAALAAGLVLGCVDRGRLNRA